MSIKNKNIDCGIHTEFSINLLMPSNIKQIYLFNKLKFLKKAVIHHTLSSFLIQLHTYHANLTMAQILKFIKENCMKRLIKSLSYMFFTLNSQ